MNSPSLSNLRSLLQTHQHRCLVILSGQPDWQIRELAGLWQSDERVLWIGETANETIKGYEPEAIPSKRLPHYLGQEADGVIIDLRQGYSANTLGIVAGLIRAGGLLVLLTPDLDQWRTMSNPENARFLSSPYTIDQATHYFNEHLIRQWQNEQNHQVVWCHQNDPHKDTLTDITRQLVEQKSLPPIQLPTTDQKQAIEAIDSVAFGHRKRPLVISADRGRGKSSLLGIAAVECLIKGKQHIVLTASRLDQVRVAFEQAIHQIKNLYPQAELTAEQAGRVCFNYQDENKVFEFIAPDQLVLQPTSADVFMVDEAAHLPTPLLTQLLQRHHRMVFATTLHGYEGSGRGFELRFKKTLNSLTPDWKNLHLNQPIRWAHNDPLEQAVNRALLLNPAPLEESEITSKTFDSLQQESLELQSHSAASLSENSERLHEVFSLLVQAHYQTTPNDLQQLLSAPNLTIITATYQQKIVGVTLCVEEGKIMPNHHRVHGHLVPQLLVKNYAQANFLMLSTWRIMRIAVHPQYQRLGIGKRLLSELKAKAQLARVDYLSSSFGASEELLPFWFHQDYRPVHVGVKRDKASGSYNLVVVQALSSMAQQAIAQIQRNFQAQFPHTLMESLPFISAPMILCILQTFRFKTQQPQLEEALRCFLDEKRAYESISGQLWEWSIRSPMRLAKASKQEQAIWCDKILKKHSWQDVAHNHHLAGRKGVESALREIGRKI